MGGNSWTSYIVGAVVGIVVGIFTFGIGFAAYAVTAGTLAFSLTTSYMLAQQNSGATDMGGVKSAAAKELQIVTASEALSIPVTFGKVRLSGNILRYDYTDFKSVAKYDTVETSGGKGGGGKKKKQKVLTGYDYFLSYDVGFCMGPVDEIGLFWDGNNLQEAGLGTDEWTDDGVPTSDHFEAYQRVQIGNTDGTFGGEIIVHRGTETQHNRGNYSARGDGQFYRHICFASLGNFKLGSSPVVRTLMMEITRWPKCVDAAGDPIAGLLVQGSLADSGPAWYDANPAAVLWEIFTNKIWGRGMSPDLMDAASFVECSEYFAEKDIGISFALESQDAISSTVDFVRQHCATVVVWDGAKMFCRCMMNTAAFRLAATISSDQVKNVQFVRPAWPETINELRVEFTNRATGYKPEIAMIQDDAAINVTGGVINSTRVSLPGFHRRELAEQQASRILSEMAYPAATITFYMNQWARHLLPGDLIAFVWSEWSEGLVTTFYNVAEINDSEQSADGIRITAQENMYITPYNGEPVPIVPTYPGWEGDTFNDDGDLYLGEDHQGQYVISDMSPVNVWEMPPIMTGGLNMLAFTAEQGSGSVNALAHYWTPDGLTEYEYLGQTPGTAITGEITIAPPNAKAICRDNADKFTITLTNADNQGVILGSANKVVLPSDNLEALIQRECDILLVGGEIILIGSTFPTSPGVIECSNYLRGAFGTEIETHAPGAPFAFIPAWSFAGYILENENELPYGVVDWRSYAITVQGQSTTAWDHSFTYVGRGETPYAPEYRASAAAGTSWTGQFRPRFVNAGALWNDTLNQDFGALILRIPDGMSYVVRPYNGASPNGDFEPLPVTFTPDDGTTQEAGVCDFTYTSPAATTTLRIYAMLNGKRSLAYMTATP